MGALKMCQCLDQGCPPLLGIPYEILNMVAKDLVYNDISNLRLTSNHVRIAVNSEWLKNRFAHWGQKQALPKSSGLEFSIFWRKDNNQGAA